MLPLLVAFIRAIVGEVRLAGRPVSKVLFLIDETAKVNEVLKNRIGCNTKDVWQIIRTTLLGTHLEAYAYITTALVISTLDYAYLNVSDSVHPYHAIVGPTKLDNDKIIDVWLRLRLEQSNLPFPEDQRQELKRLASAFVQAPRTVEIFVEAVVAHLSKRGSLNSTAYSLVLADIMDDVHLRYPSLIELPKPKYLHALLHGTPLQADLEVQRLIRASMYSNIITEFPRQALPYINPETAFILLVAAAEEEYLICNKAHRLESTTARIAKAIIDMFRSFTLSCDKSKIGLLLENVLANASKESLPSDDEEEWPQ